MKNNVDFLKSRLQDLIPNGSLLPVNWLKPDASRSAITKTSSCWKISSTLKTKRLVIFHYVLSS